MAKTVQQSIGSILFLIEHAYFQEGDEQVINSFVQQYSFSYQLLVCQMLNEPVKLNQVELITKQDLNWLGKLKSKKRTQLLQDKQFDTLFVIGNVQNGLIKSLNCDFKNKIAVNCEENKYFKINLKIHSKFINEICNFAFNTMKNIYINE